MKYLAVEKELLHTGNYDFDSVLREEAAKVYDLYLKGIVRECYFTKEDHTAVLILECRSEDEAREVLDSLPLVREKIIDFQLLTLLPYTGLDRILDCDR